MSESNKVSLEMREGAIRMVQKQREKYPSLWAPSSPSLPRFVPETLNEWLHRAEVNSTGAREGVTSSKAQRMKTPLRQLKELRRTSEVLKLASALFARAELDRRLKSLRPRPASACLRS